MWSNTSGETMQSLNSSACRCAHAGVIFSPPQNGMSLWDADWKRLIQQEVTGRNSGAYSRCIDRLTEFDTHEHPLQTLLGRGYHSSTLGQFLGQLERIGAAEAWLPVLVPAKVDQ